MRSRELDVKLAVQDTREEDAHRRVFLYFHTKGDILVTLRLCDSVLQALEDDSIAVSSS